MISYFHLVKAPFLCSCRHQFPERIWSHFLASHSAPNSPIGASGLFPGAILVMEMQRSLPSPSLSAAFSSYEHILPLETPLLSVSMTPTLLLFLHHILLCWAWMGFFFCYAFLLDYPVLPITSNTDYIPISLALTSALNSRLVDPAASFPFDISTWKSNGIHD